MPTTKPAAARKTPKSTKPFSLVPAAAQQEMYRALVALKPSLTVPSGAEVAEIAVCLAAGEPNPVILACSAQGARIVRKGCRNVSTRERRLTAATLAAIGLLLGDGSLTDETSGETREMAAVVCAGRLKTHIEALQDYRAAFRFASRHKLPILFLVANSLAPGQPPQLDLRTLYPEFGIPLFSVDANDAIAAYRVATEALHNARHLRGPCVIEALAVHYPDAGAPSPLHLLAGYMKRHGIRPS
jgi:Dehydrogenase E1 component